MRPSCFNPRKPPEQRIRLLTVSREAAIRQREAQSYQFLAMNRAR
jgi:hypothetical protein